MSSRIVWRNACLVLFCVTSSLGVYSTHSLADEPLDELILLDQTGDEKKFDEGLVRQRLGLLDADGKPMTQQNGELVPLVSADGKKKAYDMVGGNEQALTHFAELKADQGVLTIITHGRKGAIVIDQKRVKGFGTGTGINENCDPPIQLAGAKTHLTLNMAVCKADEGDAQITSVATTLADEIVRRGGSVQTKNASQVKVKVSLEKSWRVREGYTATEEEKQAANTALDTVIGGTAIKDQYKKLQDALDQAVPPDQQGSKFIATLKYSATIELPGGESVVIRKTFPDEVGTPVIEIDSTCDLEGCAPTPTRQTSWGTIRSLYR